MPIINVSFKRRCPNCAGTKVFIRYRRGYIKMYCAKCGYVLKRK